MLQCIKFICLQFITMKKKKMKFNIVSILLMYNHLIFIVNNIFNFLKLVQVLNMFKLLKIFIKFSTLSVFKILIALKFMSMT